MMIRREATRLISTMAESHPLLIIVGPRCAGKSALVRQLLPDHIYVDLESAENTALARSSPVDFFARHQGDIIINEFRYAPEFLRHISGAVAKRHVVLITSRQLSRSAPRYINKDAPVGVITVLPPSIRELSAYKIRLGRDEYIHRGFLPDVYGETADPRETQFNYLAALLRKDIAPFVSEESRESFKRFLRLLAERVGLALNPRTFAKTVGVPPRVLVGWMRLLEAHFVVFRVPVYPSCLNAESKTISAPKFYFVDVGVAAYLLKIQAPDQVYRHPAVGNLFENLVAAEALKATCNRHAENIFYYRDREGLEIDLILQNQDVIAPIEIKSTPTFNAAFADNLKHFYTFAENIRKGYVVYSGAGNDRVKGVGFVNFRDFGKIVRRLRE